MTRLPFPYFNILPGSAGLLLVLALTGCASGHRRVVADAPSPVIAGSGITVFAAGDIADCRQSSAAGTMAARTAGLIAAGLAEDASAVVLTLGDNVYQSGTPAEHADCYAPTWGRFKQRTLPSPGNHEYYSKDAAGYYDYFGSLAGPDRRGYYSTGLGGWHVMSLNSNLKGAAQQAQLDWLKADLAAHPSTCSLAFWHHPVQSSGGHGSDERMRAAWQLLADAGTDLILSAHDHDYERFAPQGPDDAMRQFVVGTGGAELSPFRFFVAGSETANNDTFGVLRLVLKATGYEWEFMPAGGGTYRDSGSARCVTKAAS
ncbi:Alkaline phosphatase [Oxalobacteraceae bacterium IMCC9480]|nr:Alkaline phosphatase [Oxalobacteraceae bacterium IMCC9480]NDP57903.1 alkaline phosphatase [Oxalobacteraceae bacterium]